MRALRLSVSVSVAAAAACPFLSPSLCLCSVLSLSLFVCRRERVFFANARSMTAAAGFLPSLRLNDVRYVVRRYFALPSSSSPRDGIRSSANSCARSSRYCLRVFRPRAARIREIRRVASRARRHLSSSEPIRCDTVKLKIRRRNNEKKVTVSRLCRFT